MFLRWRISHNLMSTESHKIATLVTWLGLEILEWVRLCSSGWRKLLDHLKNTLIWNSLNLGPKWYWQPSFMLWHFNMWKMANCTPTCDRCSWKMGVISPSKEVNYSRIISRRWSAELRNFKDGHGERFTFRSDDKRSYEMNWHMQGPTFK